MALGINCGSKLRKIRKTYRKVKTSPFLLRFHILNAVVLDFVEKEARQPNSALRKCVRVKVISTNERRVAFIPYCGGKSFIKVHDVVTIQSIGGSKGRAKGDLTGLNYKVIKVNGVSLREKFLRKK